MSTKEDPFIRFYYYPGQKTILYEYKPYYKNFHFNQLSKYIDAHISSCDINIPIQNDNEDHNRFVEIWRVNESGDNERVMTVTAGIHLKLDFAQPIERMFLYTRL